MTEEDKLKEALAALEEVQRMFNLVQPYCRLPASVNFEVSALNIRMSARVKKLNSVTP